ncbi:Sodium:dicarboxylate symporter [Paraphysoderma sedebokerense]|nr:Sodium:dicarboxylate symporter [Paraphysoderma sedebokerense]
MTKTVSKSRSRLMELLKPGGTFSIIIAVICAVGLGLLLNHLEIKVSEDVVKLIALPGALWLKALKAIVIPLVLTNMILSMDYMKKIKGGDDDGVDGAKLKNGIIKTTLSFYLLTTLFAVATGIVASALILVPNVVPINPDDIPADVTQTASETRKDLKTITVTEQVIGIFTSLLPSNVVKAAANEELLAIIVTGIVVGILMYDGVKKPSPILELTNEVTHILTKIITALIWLSPFGIYFLLVPPLLTISLSTLLQFVGILLITQWAGIAFHLFINYQVLIFGFSRQFGIKNLPRMVPAMMTAVGTSSSAATMSVTLECCKKLGVPSAISKFVIPLGTVCNMDGAAIGFASTAIFLSLANGIQVTIPKMILIGLTSALSAIGASPIPSAGLVFHILILQTVGVPINGLFGLIIAIDWLADRPQTALNVLGDMYCAQVVSKRNPLPPDAEDGDDVDLENGKDI